MQPKTIRIKYPLHGVLPLTKPRGLSSNQTLNYTKRLFHPDKAGFVGTLDPFADGLLPVVFGEASKFIHYLNDGKKRYRLNVCFGQQTDTDDCEGQTVLQRPIPKLRDCDWREIILSFKGLQLQQPPFYSALKVGGERAYDLMRRGITPDLQAREIEIYEIKLIEIQAKNVILDVLCSKGTYMRSLARDLGLRLNSAAHAAALQRTQVGTFQLCDAYSFEQLEEILKNQGDEALRNVILPLNCLLDHLPKVSIPQGKEKYFLNGNNIQIDGFYTEGIYQVFYQQDFVGTAEIKEQRLIPQRLLNAQILKKYL